MHGRKEMIVRIGLFLLLIIAASVGMWLSHALEVPAHQRVVTGQGPSSRIRQQVPNEPTPTVANTDCVINGNIVAGCNGTTTMNGQTCTVSLEIPLHRVILQCKQ